MTIISCILFFDFCLLGLILGFCFSCCFSVCLFCFSVCLFVYLGFFLFVVDFLGYKKRLILSNFVSQIHSFLFFSACRIDFCNAFILLSWLSSVFVCCKYKTCSIDAFDCINKNIKKWKQYCASPFFSCSVFSHTFLSIFSQ